MESYFNLIYPVLHSSARKQSSKLESNIKILILNFEFAKTLRFEVSTYLKILPNACSFLPAFSQS